ncbi:MAG TPA: CoA pyrophosphatase [Polyangiaceae bacterium]|jgi:8-oxo-dGTP pyrophosphatase MutT (NUDIX family)|nr:CoA pyrophosphatase [Polyangiaceae bacterium]
MASLAELVARLDHAAASEPHVGDAEGLRAAVAAIMREHDGRAELLFIKRADRADDPWSGHMAFPGGRKQGTDRSLLHTSQRETLEEIGLDLTSRARVVARLPDVMPYASMPHPLTVTAFLFVLDAPADLTLNEEVAAVVWAPLEGVLRGDGATKFHWQKGGVDLQLPAIDIEGNIVWGLTYRMLELMREVMP